MDIKSTLLAQAADAAVTTFKARMLVLSSIQQDGTPWIPMSIPPTASGKYFVGHRGHQVAMHYLADDTEWMEGTKLGWQGDLHFGPKYWMPIPDFPTRLTSSPLL